MITKTGSARWSGGLKDGQGHVSTETGVLDGEPYGFRQRFEGVTGTNPEELIGAAHAACYAMAMSLGLSEAGLTAESIDVSSAVSLEQKDGGFAITKIHLTVTASVPGATPDQFARIAEATKTGCPVSKVLAGADITMDARLA